MSEPNSANVVRVDGVQSVVLREPSTSSEVEVVADLGSNVARFRTRVGDRPVDVLSAPPDMGTLRERPTRWGSACLFPYPGRIQGGRFTFRGREVTLPVDARDGNAIHGVARQRPWQVVATEAREGEGARVVTRITSKEAGIQSAEWPWPFELTLTTSLREGVLRVATEIANVGTEPMPFGLGFHPYFPTPSEQHEVWIEADEHWEQRDGLPTGEITELAGAEGLRKPTPLAAIPPDTQMPEGKVRNQLMRKRVSGASDAPGGVRGGIRDPNGGVSVTLEASAGFSRMVFFTPAQPPVVSLEPQTCVPNAHRLAGEGNDDAGLVVLEPGQRWRGWWELRAEPL